MIISTPAASSLARPSPDPHSVQNKRKASSAALLGTVVKARWKILQKLGQGAFGETYSARDLKTQQDVAIKIEKLDQKKMVLKLEVIALKKLQTCNSIVRYIHSGRQDDFNFLVMERLGSNIAELRKRMPEQRFSLATTLNLGIQMIQALEGVHRLSYIHRDIKPSNFCVGRSPKNKHLIFLIDFGLARKYRLPSGEIRPPRKHAGFRGTPRYASLNSHKCRELGRRDDLWSVFYVLVEFSVGQLPWRKIKAKEKICELKEVYTNVNLVRDLPDEFRLFLEHLQSLGYADEPDYSYLMRLLKDVAAREGFNLQEMPFDWDLPSPQQGSLSNRNKSPAMIAESTTGIVEKSPSITKDAAQNNAKHSKREGSTSAAPGDEEYLNIFQQQNAAGCNSIDAKVSQNRASQKYRPGNDIPTPKKKPCCTIM